ncbi:MAG: lytic murein transglycosylase B [Gammaproteobacteria bacterium]|nr:lytic murein transglycosylase B [Gammaproteobacteria bacterium]
MKYLLVLGLLFSTIVNAVEVKRGDYRDRADVAAFIVQMASRSDYSEQELVELFSTVSKQDHLFELLNKPAEKELQWYQYRPIFIKEKRIDLGVKFWREHQQLLSEVSTKTGVPEQIIIAVIGVETFYGIYKGKDPVLDSLVTLAFDYPKRGEFFTHELEQFLLLVKEQNLDPVGLLGSYAGAMGMPQFISSSYRSYAVDFDGDGQANLFDSVADITASVANYFVKHGWRANEAIAGPLTALENNTIERLEPGVKPVYKWSDLVKNGLQSNIEFDPDTAVALVKLEQRNQAEYWAGLQNFYVITRYNHSELYAMAVYQLSLLIKARMERG